MTSVPDETELLTEAIWLFTPVVMVIFCAIVTVVSTFPNWSVIVPGVNETEREF